MSLKRNAVAISTMPKVDIAPANDDLKALFDSPENCASACREAHRVGFYPENLPASLYDKPYFVAWKLMDDGKKQPVDPNTGAGFNTQTPKATGWPLPYILNKFLPCYDAYGFEIHETPLFSGLGFMARPENGITIVDLDSCRDPNTGDVKPWALDIIKKLNTYTEVSPSGYGVHCYVLGGIPHNVNTRLNAETPTRANKKAGIELFHVKGYVTLTGNTLPGYPRGVCLAQGALDELWNRYGKKRPTTEGGGQVELLTAGDVIAIMQRAANWEEVEEKLKQEPNSERDMSLCCHVAFYTKDPGTIEEVLRTLGAARKKWDDKRGATTWIQSTITKALHRVTEGWNPNFHSDDDDEAPPINPPAIKSASDLMSRKFEPVHWIVRDMLPEGTYILAAAPKIGKTWLAQDISLCVAVGEPCLGRMTRKGRVLYLALEDNERRMKSRLEKLTGGRGFDLSSFHYATTWQRGKAGVDEIRQWLEANGDAALIVVDTLAAFRQPTSARKSAYEQDYGSISGLTRLAGEFRVAILVIHHTRKMADDSDKFNQISGTLGLNGAADGMLVLERSRKAGTATLSVTGRDIENETEYGMEFDKLTCRWNILGSAEEAKLSRERLEILNILRGVPTGGTARFVADSLEIKLDSARKRLRRMERDGYLVGHQERGKKEYSYTVS
jgi:hypothetical protein